MQEYLLEFEEVHYTYPGSQRLQQSALNGLTMKIPSGKKCALIGQNGCGKTTLFLLANGLYKPNSGIVKWCGEPLIYNRQHLSKIRQKVGLVFQDPEQQLVASTVEEDISYGLCNLGLPETEIKNRVEQVLIEFGLTDLAEKPVHHLSLGQKKRVSIADVMVLQPQLLVLDEPTAYLDIKHTRNLMKTLKKIHEDGNTLLMATHDLDLVYRWADWVFVMDKGQLMLEGTPEDVFSQSLLLEELELGVPLIYEMLVNGLSPEEGIIIERVRQRILKDG
ncbi:MULTISPECIES: energy-coupling factor ABC transporter ATP-binding protein [Nostocales]|uniref:energy-coupling factor ABC transporter ATP-binding protein n=1 Tax=Nostocales TaxID=1161 RepID=UPI00029B7AE9|nr:MULTISPECIES: ABC transporter ATP-binding protein [Nostocales]AFW95530.1 cobalt ABC transporter, ATP-binding protein Cbi0 [Anabaena sp. 90]MTJ18560.1 ABC transporter ATP-binding protein [Dolichospermum sp. UHCC 0299]MTJ41204.1 ABC transporter ATP-binding protein [Dolichospermum sp. UHCC 0406]